MTAAEDLPDRKPCTECGITKPLDDFYADNTGRGLYGRRSKCKTCLAEQKRRYREANLERVREQNRQYAQDNRAAMIVRSRLWRENNREAEREGQRRRRQASHEAALASGRRYRAANDEAIRKRRRIRYQASRDTERERLRRRIAADRAVVLAHYSTGPVPCCACCKTVQQLTVDHVNGGGTQHRREVAGSAGRSAAFYRWLIAQGFPPGYQVLCKSCNSSKGPGERCRLHDGSPPRRKHRKIAEQETRP